MPRPILVLHATSALHMLDGILQVLESQGISCSRRDYGLAGLTTSHETHLIWGMRYRPPVYQELSKLENVFFVENGWLTQRTGCYIDKSGSNALSSIRGALSLPLSAPTPGDKVRRFLGSLHNKVHLRPVTGEGDYIFVPLQVEKDSQLLFWSGCPVAFPRRQVWLVDQVCMAFPGHKIIIRPHPRDTQTVERLKKECQGLRRHPGVVFRTDRTSYDWLASARAVVGINSTVLLEALTFFKPVCAMGFGVFSENGVVLECQGDPSRLQHALSFTPDVARIEQFLHLLMRRQIPYNLDPTSVEDFPVLGDLVRVALRQSLDAKAETLDRRAAVFRPASPDTSVEQEASLRQVPTQLPTSANGIPTRSWEAKINGIAVGRVPALVGSSARMPREPVRQQAWTARPVQRRQLIQARLAAQRPSIIRVVRNARSGGRSV